MTDHTIPADKLRELIDDLREEAAELESEEWGSMIAAERAAELRGTADRIESLLPAPSIDPATCAPDRLYRVEHHNGREYLGWRLAPEDSEYPWMISGGWWCRDHRLTVLGEATPLDPTDAQNLADMPVDAPDTTHIPAGGAWLVEIGDDHYHAIPDRSGAWHYIDDEGDRAEDWRAVPLHRLVQQQQARTVTTEAEYAALPVGTIVVTWYGMPAIKGIDGTSKWGIPQEDNTTDYGMEALHSPCVVLRWGDEEAQG